MKIEARYSKAFTNSGKETCEWPLICGARTSANGNMFDHLANGEKYE